MKTKIAVLSILAVFSAMIVVPVFARTAEVNPAVSGTTVRVGTSTPSTLSTNAQQLKLLREQAEKERKAKIETATAAQQAINVTCMQGAVDTRDTAIGAAFDAFHTSVKTALDARKAALKAAWAITDGQARKAALKAAWANYTTAAHAARKTLESARKDAWKAFASTAKTCGKETRDEMASEGKDSQL